MKRTDWNAVKQAYLDGEDAACLARRFKIRKSLIAVRAEQDGWDRMKRARQRLRLADQWLAAAEAAGEAPAEAEKMAKALSALAAALKTLEALEPNDTAARAADPDLVREFDEEIERLVRQRLNERHGPNPPSGSD